MTVDSKIQPCTQPPPTPAAPSAQAWWLPCGCNFFTWVTLLVTHRVTRTLVIHVGWINFPLVVPTVSPAVTAPHTTRNRTHGGKLRHSWRGGPFQPHLHSCQEAGPISEVRAYRLSAQCGVLKNVGHFQRLGNSRPAACMYFWVPIPGKLHFYYVPLGGAQ